MTKPVPVLLFAVMAAIAAPDLGGQASTMPQPNAAASPKVPISPALVLREITLNLRDGTIVRGRLSAATAASILVRQDDQEQEYALRDIRKAIVDPKPQRAKGVLPGIVLGFYAGNISLSYFPTPGFYVETYHGIRVFSLDPFWGQALIAAVGGFLGSRTPARAHDGSLSFQMTSGDLAAPRGNSPGSWPESRPRPGSIS